MNLRPAELSRHLASSSLQPLYVLHGDEPLLALESAQQIREAAAQAGFAERVVLTVEPGFKWPELAYALQSGSLFSDRRLIELRIPGGKPGTEGGEALQRSSASLNADTLLLVQLPKLEKVQLQSKWFTALSQAGAVVACQALDRADLPAWISRKLAAQGQTLNAEAMDWLVGRVEGNLLAAKQEIDKLALLHPPGTLTLDALQAEVAKVARYDVWGLGEALVAGDPARYLRMLEGLRAEGEAPHLILWTLSEELRALMRVGLGRSRKLPLPQLFRENRVWGDKQKLYPEALDRLKASRIRAGLQHAARIDRIVKGVASGDAWEELQLLGLRLMPVHVQL